MSIFGGADDLELFLSRCRVMSVGSVPVYLAVMVFFIKEEGWHFSLLLCGVLPLIAACLGVRGNREIRPGMSAAGLALACATLPLTFVLASLEGS
ncbi:hypothetical protein J7F01_33870 [Streptomyces sp. ISL-22]|uniref:hypothetical protein n=1 Tax=unclassified Streptomyces TaxID=2593676 RepID=UPI001BEB4CC1|nr:MULTISPECIES: hypothetical protein [unclassified Streptomyces]MBT2421264.1 hypothetical protein [Streptomyces sp. ISL-24]MBT2437061.1 hypothetical protein [Streptomyces sp. ISL-22]